MFKKITVTLCIGLLLNLFFYSTASAKGGDKDKISKVRAKILSLGTGTETEIKLTLYDKTKIKGYISESNEENFTVMDTNTNQAVKVTYPQVKKASGRNNLSGRTIAIAFIVLVLVAAIIVGVAGSDY